MLRLPYSLGLGATVGEATGNCPLPCPSSVVTLEIDNRLCFQASDKCFPDARSAADYLAALAAVERLEFPYPIKAVHSECRWGRG